MKTFNYSNETDLKWQKKWKETKLYKFDEAKIKDKFYLLEMFSYPSGKNLHIGHWWNFGLSDSYGRFKRMQGYQLFHPFGFDAFGLPAENYAIATGVHPKDSIQSSIATMEEQFRQMGTTYDWDYEIVTCDEEYYKWTQWLFLKLCEKGLAYRKEAPVNWCPSCMTVLANEQADGGICERCESTVIQKDMIQWFFKITEYAEELLSGLDTLDWPEKTKLIQKNWIGKSIDNGTVKYRLHDWLVSRQRYWGAPVPVVYCEDCGVVPVTEKDLPVRLPYDVEFRPNGQSPLTVCNEFINTLCPVCGKPAKRDTDTLDTFVCSSWYYLRFYDNKNADAPFDIKRAEQIMPVDKYIGGVEHAAMHLLYARFVTKALRDMGYLSFDEPFPSLFHQGLITGADGKKMSKRDGAVSPDVLVRQYGSDVFRMYLGFGFSFINGDPWDDNGIKAIVRFVSRIGKIADSHQAFKTVSTDSNYKTDDKTEYILHNTIKQVGAELEALSFNTAISRIMEYINAIQDYQKRAERNLPYEETLIKNLILLLAPLAPHLAEELWENAGFPYSVHNQSFPVYDDAKLVRDMIEIAVQVNGVLRDVVQVARGTGDEEIKTAAMASVKIQENIRSREINKIIFIKGRLINIVCKDK